MQDGTPIIYLRSGLAGRAYQARSVMACDTCEQRIEKGEYYARNFLVISGTMQISCNRCKPFRIVDIITGPEIGPNDGMDDSAWMSEGA